MRRGTRIGLARTCCFAFLRYAGEEEDGRERRGGRGSEKGQRIQVR